MTNSLWPRCLDKSLEVVMMVIKSKKPTTVQYRYSTRTYCSYYSSATAGSRTNAVGIGLTTRKYPRDSGFMASLVTDVFFPFSATRTTRVPTIFASLNISYFSLCLFPSIDQLIYCAVILSAKKKHYIVLLIIRVQCFSRPTGSWQKPDVFHSCAASLAIQLLVVVCRIFIIDECLFVYRNEVFTIIGTARNRNGEDKYSKLQQQRKYS